VLFPQVLTFIVSMDSIFFQRLAIMLYRIVRAAAFGEPSAGL